MGCSASSVASPHADDVAVTPLAQEDESGLGCSVENSQQEEERQLFNTVLRLAQAQRTQTAGRITALQTARTNHLLVCGHLQTKMAHLPPLIYSRP